MRDSDVFGVLLGLTSDWTVSSVDLDDRVFAIRLSVQYVGSARCPICKQICKIHDHCAERSWRHLDTMQYTTHVVCRVPRVDCPDHGVKQVSIPWAGPKSRFTEMFECLAIRMLQLIKCQYRTATLLKLSPGQVHDIMDRAVNRGLSRRVLDEIPHLSIDEKSFQRGQDYGTVLCDVLNKRVLDMTRGRKEEAAEQAMECLPHPELVKTITMDMWVAFKNAAETKLSQADIIHDRFHIAAMLGEAVDDTRRAEVRKSPELEKTRHIWLKNPENLTDKQRPVFEALVRAELKTAEAYGLKQVFRGFFEQDDVQSAETFFSDWMREVEKRELPHILKVAKTLQKNLPRLLNYVKWKLANGYAEAVNALIQEVKTIARGFRKFENFRVAILFFLGKLDLYPRNSP